MHAFSMWMHAARVLVSLSDETVVAAVSVDQRDAVRVDLGGSDDPGPGGVHLCSAEVVETEVRRSVCDAGVAGLGGSDDPGPRGVHLCSAEVVERLLVCVWAHTP